MEAGSVPRIAVALAVLAAALVLPACSTQVTGPSLVLSLASPAGSDEAGSSDAVKRFVDEVDRRSGGAVRIEPVWQAVQQGTPQWDQETARLVADGTYDLGLIPGRAFDLLGVDTLRPLNAPFLVTSAAAVRAVLDSSLRDDLLAGLPEADLAGLDLFPDGLRHPFGNAKPLLGPQDYVGGEIRSPASATVAAMFAALGSTVSDSEGYLTQQLGAESQFSLPQADFATGNVTFFPKTNALVAGMTLRDGLRPDQWALLKDAAAATREWLHDALPSELDDAVAYCENRGTIVAATTDQLAGLRSSTASVVETLRDDPELRRLVDAIARTISDLPEADPVTACPGVPDEGDVSAIDGRYRTWVTERDLEEAGVTDPRQIRDNTGRFTWILDDGVWTYHQRADHFANNTDDSGFYEYEDGVFTMDWSAIPDNWTRARVTVADDGSLTFDRIVDGRDFEQSLSEGFFGSRPWTRVGDPPG